MRLSSLAAATVLLLAAACSSEPEVREPDPTPAPSVTPSAAAPTMPAQAKEDSSEGAVAFVNHWIEVSNAAALSGDTTRLTKLSASSCDGCNRYVNLYEKTYAEGGYFKGGERRMTQVRVQRSKGSAEVRTRLKAGPERFKADAKSDEESVEATQSDVVFTVQRRAGAWQVSYFGLAEES